MINKSKIILIGVIIATAIFSIIIVSLFKPSQTTKPSSIPVQSLQPQPTANTKPPVLYDSQKNDKLLSIVKDRPTLSTSDLAIRSKLLASLGNKSGILNQTNTYILEYVQAPNIFQTEILITDINLAKTQATQWLLSQGLSSGGLCKLPVMFYLNRQVANQLRGQDIMFNPLPEGC